MTKLDAAPLGYVHCKDIEPIMKAVQEYQKEVTFRGLPSCQVSDASSDSGRATATSNVSSTGNSSASSTDSRHSAEFQVDVSSLGATSDELYDSIVAKRSAQNKAEELEMEACTECRQLNLKQEQQPETERAYLAGMRCQKHSDLMKNSAVILHKSVSSPIRTPLSNYDNRKRNVSGGSIIKQLVDTVEKTEEEAKEVCRAFDFRAILTLTILLLANLLNYMDRYTIAGVLIQVQDFYNISNAQAGLLQTSFIVFYMLFSPIFGFFGDRWNRKLLMAGGIAFWSLVTLAGSFVPQDKFWLFLLMRAMVGIGEASYSTIAPTIIADLFVKDKRSAALSVFYFAIPVGSGLGYIVGSKVAKAMGNWQWALRVTPGLGVLCVVLILLVVKEPPRGEAEGGTHLHSTSWGRDLKYLVSNKSFMFSTGGFTCVAFVAGALSLWAPAYIEYSMIVQQHNDTNQAATVALYFGIITCIAGFLGVGLGSESARRLRKTCKNADPLVCAFGLIMCAPFLFLVMFMAKYNTIATWVLIFIGETFLCLNWAIVTDILLYTVIPTRRSTAEAVQILVSHALGDAGSPYLIGVLSDSIQVSDNEAVQKFVSLQYAMYMTCFVAVLGGGFFLATALFVQQDRAKADKIIKCAIDAGKSERSLKDTTSTTPADSIDASPADSEHDISATTPAIAV